MFFNYKHRYYYILLLAAYAYINTAICKVYFYFHLDIVWYDAFLIILIITFFSWESNRLIHPTINKWFPLSQNIARYAISFCIAGFIISGLLTIITDFIFGMILQRRDIEEMMNPLKMTLTYALLINLLFHLLNTIFLYAEGFRKKSIESETLKRMHAQAELMAIRQQINPHFLFNNLNVLSGLILQQSAAANSFIEAFSQVYMHILNTHNKELVPLQEEIDFLQPYTYLLQQRFPNAFSIKIDVPLKYRSCYIIPVALQMLVENAIKHNIASSKKPLNIYIYINDNAITVENNLQLKQVNNTSSYSGLKNIHKRYELVTGKTVILNKNAEIYAVTLPLIQINNYEGINN